MVIILKGYIKGSDVKLYTLKVGIMFFLVSIQWSWLSRLGCVMKCEVLLTVMEALLLDYYSSF